MSAIPTNPSKSVRDLNPHLFPNCDTTFFVEKESAVSPIKRIRQSPKPLMNKLETEFFLRLQQDAGDIKFIRPQSIRFMLGNGIWYKPDFTGFVDGSFSAWEVKGPHAFRGGFENLKVAAHQFVEVHWYLVWKNKNGQWQQQRVLP